MTALRLHELLIPAVASAKAHREWEARVSVLAGEVSLPPGQIRGRWKGGGSARVEREAPIPVRIACDRRVLRKILAFTAAHYRQQEVLAYQVSPEAILFWAKAAQARR